MAEARTTGSGQAVHAEDAKHRDLPSELHPRDPGWKLQLSNGQGSSSHTQKSEEYTRKQLKAYQDLYNEVRQAPPLGILSYKVKCDIENLCSDKEERRLLVSKVHRESGCSPLFIACKKGNIEIVEYLLSHCDADVEQKGLYEVQDDRTVHHVSPLWCAR